MKKLIFMLGIITAMFQSAWAITPQYAESLIPGLVSIIDSDADQIKSLYGERSIADLNSIASFTSEHNITVITDNNFDNAPEGSVAIISKRGVISKYDGWCSYGTASISNRIRQADNHPNISSIVHIVDSGGGTVDGTEAWSKTVSNTNKPIVAYVDGVAASACYWGISGANEIMCSSSTDTIGSIGTMWSFADFKPVLEEKGVIFHEIYASLSKSKNKAFREALDGNPDLIKAKLDELNNIFINSVKENRSFVDESVFSGETYLTAQAIEKGLADSMGTLNDAILRADELANELPFNISI